MSSVRLKTNFAVESKHEAFFTGGKVQVLKNGEHVFCQCGTQVKALHVSTGKTTHNISQEDEAEVTSFAVTPDDKTLVVAYRNLVLKQWDWQETSLTRTWKAIHTGPVSCMTFDPTSTLLATGGSDGTVKVWDIIKQYCTHNLRGHQGVISVAEFHPDISRLQLLTAADDYKLRLWQLETSTCMAVLDSHYSVITSLQFSPEGNTLYSGSRDKVLIVWNLETYEKKKTIPVFESVEGLALLPKAETGYPDLGVKNTRPHLITAGSKGVVRVWDVDTGHCVHPATAQSQEKQEEGEGEGSQAIISLSLQQDTLTVVTYDQNILQYNLSNLALQKQFAGYSDDVLDVKFLGAGDSHVAVATNSELIKVFQVATWQCQILHGHTSIVMALDVYKDASLLASSSKDHTLRLWQLNADTGLLSCVAVAHGHTHSVLSLALPKMSLSFLVSGSQDLTMKLWTLPAKFEAGHIATLQARITEKVHDKDINSLTVSPNDKLIATGSQDKTVKVWSSKSLALVGVCRGHRRGIWCVQFSPVDQCLATASADTCIKIWALSDFSCVKTFEGHESSVLRVQFLSRGMQLLSSGSDGLVKLWTIKNNECVKTLDEHEDKIWALAVNTTEDLLVTGAADSNIIVWKDVTETELEENRAKQMDFILKEQQLQNLIQQKKYLKAIGLAITLEQPFRLLGIIQEILGAEETGTADLENTLLKLRDDQLDGMLRYMVQWNSNSRHCHVAQTVLALVLRTFHPQQLLALPNARSSLEGLLPYTERHHQRMNRLLQQTMFVDYTWRNMRRVADVRLSGEEDMETEATATPESAPVGKASEQEAENGGIDQEDETSDSDSEAEDSDESTEPTVKRGKTDRPSQAKSTPAKKAAVKKGKGEKQVHSSKELIKSGGKKTKRTKSADGVNRGASQSPATQSAKHKRRKSAVK